MQNSSLFSWWDLKCAWVWKRGRDKDCTRTQINGQPTVQRSWVRLCHQYFCLREFILHRVVRIMLVEWEQSVLVAQIFDSLMKSCHGQFMFNEDHNFYSFSVQDFTWNWKWLRMESAMLNITGFSWGHCWYLCTMPTQNSWKKWMLGKLERVLSPGTHGVNELCSRKAVDMDTPGCWMKQRTNDMSWSFCFRLWDSFGIYHHFQLPFLKMCL